MLKEYIGKEIDETIEIKKDLEKKLLLKGKDSSDSNDLVDLISEQEDKLSDLNKMYDLIAKAEQYQNLAIYGKNYAIKDPTFFQKENLDLMETERQSLALNLHNAIVQVILHFSEKARNAATLVDTDPEKAKADMITISLYLRDVISRLNQEVINQSNDSAFQFNSDKDNQMFNKSYKNNDDVANKNSIDSLTRREKDVLISIARGMSNKEIGFSLKISERTVKNHVSNIFKKINVMDRTQAALFAIRNNLVDIF